MQNLLAIIFVTNKLDLETGTMQILQNTGIVNKSVLLVYNGRKVGVVGVD